MYSLNVYPAPSKSWLFLGAGSASPTFLRFASGSRSTSGSSLPPGQGLGWQEGGPAGPGHRHHAPSLRPHLAVFTQGPRMRVAQTGAGGSGKGAEGRVQARLRNGDRKGPAGGGVGASAASPSAPAAGSAAAVASAASVPSVTRGVPRAPTVCEALCWDPAGEEGPLWGPCFDLGRTTTNPEPCSVAMRENEKRKRDLRVAGGGSSF